MSRKIYKDLMTTSGTYFIVSIIGVISGVLFPRLLGPDQWGLWSITRGVTGLLGPIAQLAMSTTLTTYISKFKGNKSKVSSYINSAYFIAILSSIIVALSVIFLSDYLASSIFEDDRLRNFLLLGSGIIFFNQLSIINRDYFRGFKDFKKYNILKVVPSISVFLLSLSFLILFSYQALYLATARFLVLLLVCISVFVYLFRYEKVFNLSELPRKNVTKRLLKFGIPLIFTMTFMTVMKSVDRVLIGYFLEATNVGIYSVAAGIPLMIGAMFTPISTVLLPTFSDRHEEGKSSQVLLKEIFSLLVFLSIPLIIFLILFSEDILLIIWGSEYILGAPVLAIASLEIFFYSGRRLFGSPIVAAEKTGTMALLIGAAALANVILNIILIPTIGIEGAAIGTVLSFALLFILMLYFINKDYRIKFKDLDVKIMVLLVVSLIFIGFFLKSIVDGIMSLIISGFVFLGVSSIFVHISSPIWYKEMMKFIKDMFS